MQLLLQMSVCRTTSGKQQLHDSLVSQLDFEKPLVVKPDSIVKTISVLFHAKSFYSVSRTLFSLPNGPIRFTY